MAVCIATGGVTVSEPSIITLEARDPYLRWAASRLLAWRRSDLEFMNCDLTRMFCKRLNEDPTELVGRSFVWEMPPVAARCLRYYEEDFIKRVLPIAHKLPALIVIAHDDVPVRRVARLCDCIGRAKYTRGGFCIELRWFTGIAPERIMVAIPTKRKKGRAAKVS